MKIDQLSEVEMFRMAVEMASNTLAADQRIVTTVNPQDVMIDRIKDCHSAILASAREILSKPDSRQH